MRAVVRRSYGDTSTLSIEDMPTPVAGAGEVVIRVEAASGELRVPLAGTYPLEQAAAAVDSLRRAAHAGKLVLVP